MKFEVLKTNAKKPHRFRLVGLNGEKVAPSQGYTRRASAVRAIRRMKAAVGAAKIIFIK